MRGRKESGSEEKDGEGEREVEGGGEVVRRMERKEGRGSEEDGKEGGREAVRKRVERKGEKGSEEDDYFNKFPSTMPSVVLENRSIRMFNVSYRSAPK